MTRATPHAAQDVLRRRPPDGLQAEEGRRVQVPLNAAVRADSSPSRIDRNPPVDADDIPSRGSEGFEESGRARSEVDARDSRLTDFLEEAAREREHVCIVIPG